MDTSKIAALYVDWDHVDGAEHIITCAIKACADALGTAAANEPDKQMQRRSVLSDVAHDLRLATVSH